MEEIKINTQIIKGFEDAAISMDLQYKDLKKGIQPIAIFVHGFKGFKDWGAFNEMSKYMANNGMALLKFNFSRNGTTVNEPTKFANPEAFGQNNYTIELAELGLVLDWVYAHADEYQINKDEVYLIGHSRGATLSIIKAVEDERVKKVVAWSPFFDIKGRFRPETIAEWDKTGKTWVTNKRTGEKLPLYRQFYEDFLVHQHRLDMHEVCAQFEKPLLIIHAKDDEAVEVAEARKIYEAVPHSIKIEMETGGHTFGIKHPFDSEQALPEVFAELLENTFEFLVD